ncbi:hypothetical protein SAMN05421890_4076 [Ensifer adhaerens]|nr:hypothetical protein SAMN05421890_4076 [Ensifer adhaerens]HZG28146.1 hypothetical protein [Ensifer sp.]
MPQVSGFMPPYFPEGRKIQAQNGAFNLQAATANVAEAHRDTPYYNDKYSLQSQLFELAANPKAPGTGVPFRVAHTAYEEHLKRGPSTALK